MKWLTNIILIIVGVIFIFSGIIKLNDPIGTKIKLEEYFEVFSQDFSPYFHFFTPYSLAISIVLSVAEVVLGVNLLVRFQIKMTLWLLLAMIIFFTLLTFYSAYYNKVTDCGCFGDVIKLTPWQSFKKDVILLILIIYLITQRQKIGTLFSKKIALAFSVICLFLASSIAIYSILHLPIIDFSNYAVGKSIPLQMKNSAPLRFSYTMQKDGKMYEMQEYPTDTTYQFVKMTTINPEDEAKIKDFRIWNDSANLTDASFKGDKLFIIIEQAKNSHIAGISAINTLVTDLKSTNIEIWILTSTPEQEFEDFRHETQLAVPYYFADNTVLKTMMRSNPGMMLVSNGVVKGKWAYRDVPSANDVKNLL